MSRKNRQRVASVRPRTPPSHRSLKIAALILTAFCLLGWFSSEAADTDFWWHLKTGQFIVERHALPVPDPFAYTTPLIAAAHPEEQRVRHFNLTHEWLAQALMYLVYSIGGFPLVILARAALLAATCALSGLLAARFSKNFYAGLAAAFATASVMTVFRADRPTILSFLFVAIFITLLELRLALWTLPALSLLWANCHGGFFLGWAVLLAYCIAPWERRTRLWWIAACSIAASGLNPNGFGVVATLFSYRRSPMTASLWEWHSPSLWGPPYAFDILLYLSILVLLLSWRTVRPAHWALFVLFAGASLTAFRNIPLIAFLAPVLIAAYVPPPVGTTLTRLALPLRRSIEWAVPAILLIAILAAGIPERFRNLRAAEWSVPSGAADYLLDNHITGRMFNVWAQGGYLMWKLWPAQHVFIDGRALSESLNRDYQQILNNPGGSLDRMDGPRAALLDRYGIQVVVMNTFEYASGGLYPLALALANRAASQWQLVYDDTRSLVFLRNPPPGTPVISGKFDRVLDHMDTECAAHIEHAPETPACARTQAQNWMLGRRPDRAIPMLRLYLTHAVQPDPVAEQWWRSLGGGSL